MPSPSHFVGALIINQGGFPVGTAQCCVDVAQEPANRADVVAWAARITARAHADGDLPLDQRYLILSWQRFRDGA